jgi:hypothetical protein
MTIRPVSRCLPTSQELWDDTNLPFCVVLTPCEEEDDDNDDDATPFAKPLAAIPKCLHCGAPHFSPQTHFRPQYSSQLLCYLCGKASSTVFVDQQDGRSSEHLDVDTYDKSSRHELKTRGNDDDVHTLDFRVPLESKRNHPQKPSLTWQLPAMACPPVWWIIVDGTVGGSRKHSVAAVRNYWTTLGNTLQLALQDAPPHVHVGLLTATSHRLSSWKFTCQGGASSTPHVRHVPYTYGGGEAWNDLLSLVPADALHKDAILAAVRAMVDGAATNGLFWENQTEEEKKEEPNDNLTGIPLGLTLEILLDFMEQATHPGQQFDRDNSHDDAQEQQQQQPLHYAGGKILCLLGNPPMEIVPSSSESSMAKTDQPPFYQGGVAGACFVADNENRWSIDPMRVHGEQDTDDTDPTDLTAQNLKDYGMPLEPEDMFQTIGKRCANAALGVDVIVLVPEVEPTGVPSKSDKTNIPWYGLPLLRVLSDTSGAPGPLMFGTAHDLDSDTTLSPSMDTLHDNIMARTPWQAGMVFGSQLRLRISPGFELEDAPVEMQAKQKLQLAPFLSSGGLMGPAYASDDQGGLWTMGTCDPYTSLTVDLQAAKHVKDRYHVDGFGEVALRPVIQTCMMYTCIETDGSNECPNYYTVCKMRISSIALPLVDYAELIYDALDPEALAAVLFHKISLDAYLSGFMAAQDTAESWLRSLMVCVYHSAQVEQAKLEKAVKTQQQIQQASLVDAGFIASERLLDLDGDLEVQDVLMGYGHPKVAVIPLLVFALMQCDALRPSGGNFQPSIDARLCALAQMASMTPPVLAKAIAPSLMLWSMKQDELIMETLPLRMKGISEALESIAEDNDGILLMDSPRQVMLYLADRIRPIENGGTSRRRVVVEIGPDLEVAILSCLKGSRTVPSKWKDLEAFLDGKEFKETPSIEFESTLLEDAPTASGVVNFKEWKMEMALTIQEDLEKSGDVVTS